jgi:sugar lactone lactonase YvrE
MTSIMFPTFLLVASMLAADDLPPAAIAIDPQHTVVNNAPDRAPLEIVAEFPLRQVTGVTVSTDGRVFVNFPLWNPEHYQGAVAEVMQDGTLRSYPDEKWNMWRPGMRLALDKHFVCVQSVVADGEGSLWVLDPGAPQFEGPLPGAAKLVQIDLETNEVERVVQFDDTIVPKGSYLNDVRIDLAHDHAYMTDSGLGALIVLNLETGEAHRVLDDHPSTSAEDIVPMIGNRPLRVTGSGDVPQIHSDGIALDRDAEYLYYHALTGYHSYRVPTTALRDLWGRPESLAAAVEDLGSDAITDGMHLDAEGNLYFTALEYDGILKRTPRGDLQPVVIDERLRWPDTLAIGPDGELYITTSQIHLGERFVGNDVSRQEPYRVFRIDLELDSPR